MRRRRISVVDKLLSTDTINSWPTSYNLSIPIPTVSHLASSSVDRPVLAQASAVPCNFDNFRPIRIPDPMSNAETGNVDCDSEEECYAHGYDSSSSVDDNVDIDNLRKELAIWAITYGISGSALSSLLKLLHN